MPGRQQRLDRGVAVARVHRHPRVAGEGVAQHVGFLGQQLAGGDPVLRAQRMRQQPRRTGVGMRAVLLPARLDRGQVALDRRVPRGLGEQPADAVAGLAGLLRGFAIQPVQAAAGMGVECETGGRLGGERIAQRQQHDMLEHVGVVAGMEGVAIVHRGIVASRATSHPQRNCRGVLG